MATRALQLPPETIPAEDLLVWAYEEFGDRLCLTCSWQKQSSVLVQGSPNFPVPNALRHTESMRTSVLFCWIAHTVPETAPQSRSLRHDCAQKRFSGRCEASSTQIDTSITDEQSLSLLHFGTHARGASGPPSNDGTSSRDMQPNSSASSETPHCRSKRQQPLNLMPERISSGQLFSGKPGARRKKQPLPNDTPHCGSFEDVQHAIGVTISDSPVGGEHGWQAAKTSLPRPPEPELEPDAGGSEVDAPADPRSARNLAMSCVQLARLHNTQPTSSG